MPRPTSAGYLMAAEHIGLGCPASIDLLDSPAWRGFDVLTHTPPERAWNDALHQRGIRAMPYMTLTYQYIPSASAGWAAGDTPDCVIIDQLGRPQLHTNYLRHDGKLIYEICPNVRKARDLYLAHAENLMKSGADGLFLDNAAAARRCWGPQFGKHEHIHAHDPQARAAGRLGLCYAKAARRYRMEVPIGDDEQTYASAMLIRELRDLVRGFGPDKQVMLNGGDGSGLPEAFFENADSVMNEMFIYTTYLDCNFPPPTNLDFQDHDPLDWLQVLAGQDKFHRRGVRMNTLPSFSPHDTQRRKHALFAFCMAKLWDALPYTTADVELDGYLRQFRLGQPLDEQPGGWGAVLYREFEGGVVAANPFGIAQQATMPWRGKSRRIAVHGHASPPCDNRIVVGDDETITFKLLPEAAVLIVPA